MLQTKENENLTLKLTQHCSLVVGKIQVFPTEESKLTIRFQYGMKFISESSESKLISDSETEDILIFWRKFGRFRSKIYKSKYDVPRKQRKMPEGCSIRFLGRRHSLARPRLPKTRSCNTSRTTLAGGP